MNKPGQRETICSPRNVNTSLCSSSQLGEFLISERAYNLAHNPMVTRAVDLSHPVTIIYPVKNPGYYCTATFGYTAPHYTATMVTRCSHGNLPASQRSSLELYRMLAIANGIGYAIWLYKHSPTRPTLPLISLVVLTLCQVQIRWVLYEISNRYEVSTISTALTSLSIGTDVAQHTFTAWIMVLLAIPEMDSWTSIKPLSILLSIAACSGLQQWKANIYATDPTLAGIAIGSVGIGITVCGLMIVRKVYGDKFRSKRATHPPPCFWIFLSVLAFSALLLLIDAVILVFAAHGHNYAAEFWRRRWIMIDESSNLVFGLLAHSLAATWGFVLGGD